MFSSTVLYWNILPGPEQGTNENQPRLMECEEPPVIRFQVKWLEIIFPLAYTWKEGQKWAKANHHDLALSRSTPEQISPDNFSTFGFQNTVGYDVNIKELTEWS